MHDCRYIWNNSDNHPATAASGSNPPKLICNWPASLSQPALDPADDRLACRPAKLGVPDWADGDCFNFLMRFSEARPQLGPLVKSENQLILKRKTVQASKTKIHHPSSSRVILLHYCFVLSYPRKTLEAVS